MADNEGALMSKMASNEQKRGVQGREVLEGQGGGAESVGDLQNFAH